MTNYEAYQLAMTSVELGHMHGESVLEQMRFWAGVSYGLLALTLVAPQRLTVGVTLLILFLYISFSAATLTNMRTDLAAGTASRTDASTILEESQLSLRSVEKRHAVSEESLFLNRIALIYLPGLFFGTIGYLLVSAKREYAARKKGHED